jgi:hypothetical protein
MVRFIYFFCFIVDYGYIKTGIAYVKLLQLSFTPTDKS